MRTTVDLSPTVHRRAVELARVRHTSLSSVISELTVRGLATLGEEVTVETDPVSNLPVVSVGRRISSADVADMLDDE